jgi:hypothetical protein
MGNTTKRYDFDRLSMTTLHVPEAELLISRFYGQATLDGFYAAFKIRYDIPAKFNLIDVSQLGFSALVQPDLIRTMRSLYEVKLTDHTFAQSKRGAKTAVVVSDGIAEAVALAVQPVFSIPGQIRVASKVFYSEAKAIAWLFPQKPPVVQ